MPRRIHLVSSRVQASFPYPCLFVSQRDATLPGKGINNSIPPPRPDSMYRRPNLAGLLKTLLHRRGAFN